MNIIPFVPHFKCIKESQIFTKQQKNMSVYNHYTENISKNGNIKDITISPQE